MIFKEIYFENPAVTNVGGMGDYAYIIPYQSKESAFNMRREESDKFLLLNGIWDFKYFPAALDCDEHFYKMDFDTSTYDKTEVPSLWQLKGYEVPMYITSPYPFPFDPPHVPYANPMGCYSRNFDIDKKIDKRYILSFEGVAGAYYLWINGHFTGYGQVAHGETRFDVTDIINNGTNKIAVAVLKWSDASYIEDQDMYRLNGIFRDVYVLERDANYLKDIQVDAVLNNDFAEGEIKIKKEFFGAKTDLSVEVYDEDDNIVAYGDELKINAPKLWSAETPYLYKVLIHCGSEYIVIRTGFRKIEIKDKKFFINGKPIKFRGVNRHDSDPDNGYVMSYEDMKKDLLLMKEYNIDSIRTAHYPPQPRLLELCDELGIYVMCEADMESHGCQYIGDFSYISRDPMFKDAIVERGVKMVKQNRNFPSVVMWSLGNEASWGDNIKAESVAVKALDDTRPVHYQSFFTYISRFETENMKLREIEDVKPYIDILSFMYISPNEDLSMYENDDRPICHTEYSHAMGNSCGDIWDHWVTILDRADYCGGFVWEWNDHGIRRDGKFLSGGDFGEKHHSGSFCMDGLVSSDRTPHTSLKELKMAYAPVRIDAVDVKQGIFEITNYNVFRSLGYTTVKYSVEELGEVRYTGELKFDTMPNSSEKFSIDTDISKLKYRSYVTFTVYDGKREMFMCQHKLPVDEKNDELHTKKSELAVSDQNGIISVSGNKFEYKIGKYSGLISCVNVCNKKFLKNDTEILLSRADIDNDMWIADLWGTFDQYKPMRAIDYRHPAIFADFKEMLQEKDSVTIKFKANILQPGRPSYITSDVDYIIHSNGLMEIQEKGYVNRDLDPIFPRCGFLWKIEKDFEILTYYGCGKDESYIDKHHNEKYSMYKTTVTDKSFLDSERPMEHGSIYDTAFLALTDECGIGAAFSSESFSFNASHYDFHEIESGKTRHKSDMKKKEDVYLIVDRFMMGIGSASVSQHPIMKKYTAKKGNFEFKLNIMPLLGDIEPAEMAKKLIVPKTENAEEEIIEHLILEDVDLI